MPRKIRYTKAMGSTVPGDVEERSDIDANILVTLGVAEEIREMADEMALNVATRNMVPAPDARSANRAERRKAKAAKKGKPVKKSGYNRRDIVAEERT